MTTNPNAVAHFKRHMASHQARNLIGPWLGLSDQERAADVQTADWVPNRAMWRARGFRNQAHAEAILGG